VAALRWGAAVVSWLLLVAAALAMSAGLRLDMPVLPDSTLELDAARLVAANATAVDGVLRVRGADGNGTTLVMQPAELDPGRFRYLTLRLDDVPAVLRGMAVWRVDGAFHATPLPGRFRAAATVDLRGVAGWEGTPDAIGFALLPTDYLAAAATLDREFAFVGGRLESESWAGALRALSTQWRAYRPWNGRSNHTGGFELSTTPGPSLQLFVFLVLLVTLVAAAMAGGRPVLRRALPPALISAVALLALVQVAQIGMRAEVAARASAAVSGVTEWPLSAMPPIGNDAVSLLDLLQAEPPARVLVWGESGFMREYPTWLLRALNAASLNEPAQLAAAGDRVEGAVIVLAGPGSWELDGARLTFYGQGLNVEPVFAGAVLQAYRIIGTSPDG
jgi:hypothetical protein